MSPLHLTLCTCRAVPPAVHMLALCLRSPRCIASVGHRFWRQRAIVAWLCQTDALRNQAFSKDKAVSLPLSLCQKSLRRKKRASATTSDGLVYFQHVSSLVHLHLLAEDSGKAALGCWVHVRADAQSQRCPWPSGARCGATVDVDVGDQT